MQISETAQKIISLLAVKPNLQARDISFELVIPRKIIIEALQGELSQYVHCSETSHWALRPEVALDSSAERAAAGAADGSVQPTAAGTSSTNFAFGSLEAVRRKLLDLSGRNALLHYKHPKNNCVRLIDEMPDQIFTELSNDRLFCLIPVPSPTERQLIDAQYIEYDPATNAVIKQTYPTAAEWAKRLGLSTNFDLPEKMLQMWSWRATKITTCKHYCSHLNLRRGCAQLKAKRILPCKRWGQCFVFGIGLFGMVRNRYF